LIFAKKKKEGKRGLQWSTYLKCGCSKFQGMFVFTSFQDYMEFACIQNGNNRFFLKFHSHTHMSLHIMYPSAHPIKQLVNFKNLWRKSSCTYLHNFHLFTLDDFLLPFTGLQIPFQILNLITFAQKVFWTWSSSLRCFKRCWVFWSKI
jgi:hypothetical protein